MHTMNLYYCIIGLLQACKETFDSIDPLRDHLKEHLAALPFRCGLCPFATVTREQLDTHMQGQHNINVKVSTFYDSTRT